MKVYDNIAVFGCKTTTLFLLENLKIPHTIRHLITIGPEAGLKHEVADYCDLKNAAEARGIQVYQARYYSLKHQDDQAYLRSLKIDIAFVIGWQRLIPAEVLSELTVGAFGMHGSSMNLPLGRGRSPMNWSIIEGRQIFYTNLFRYDPGVDSGDIVDTFKFQITHRDTAETMHFKNTLAMKYLVERNIRKLAQNDFALTAQDAAIEPTYYPKRTPEDSLVDWDQDVHLIERYIRAVTRPFNGAFSFIGDQKVVLLDAQVFDAHDFGFEKLATGEIAAVFESGKFLVRCYGGMLLVNVFESPFQVKPGMRFHNNGLEIKIFARNKLGYFDVPE